jgi:hypothetical protein
MAESVRIKDMTKEFTLGQTVEVITLTGHIRRNCEIVAVLPGNRYTAKHRDSDWTTLNTGTDRIFAQDTEEDE